MMANKVYAYNIITVYVSIERLTFFQAVCIRNVFQLCFYSVRSALSSSIFYAYFRYDGCYRFNFFEFLNLISKYFFLISIGK